MTNIRYFPVFCCMLRTPILYRTYLKSALSKQMNYDGGIGYIGYQTCISHELTYENVKGDVFFGLCDFYIIF